MTSAPIYDRNLPSRLLSLPPELRHYIYQFLFEDAIAHDRHMRNKLALAGSNLPTVLKTCRFVYNEAQPLFYRLVTFMATCYRVDLPINALVTPTSRQLLRRLRVCTDNLSWFPRIAQWETAFPSLRDLAIDCSAEFSAEAPFGVVEDVSFAMSKSDCTYPIKTTRRAQVHGMMLRWLWMTSHGPELLCDLWRAHRHLRQRGGVGLNVSIEFGIEYAQCVRFFDHTSLFRLDKARYVSWWIEDVAVDSDEDRPADLDNSGSNSKDHHGEEDHEGEDDSESSEDGESSEDSDDEDDRDEASDDSEDAAALHATRPGREGCECTTCLPSIVDNPSWKVQCVFEARSWMWTINVAEHWWKCRELEGSGDLELGVVHQRHPYVNDREVDLLTASERDDFEEVQWPSRDHYFDWNH